MVSRIDRYRQTDHRNAVAAGEKVNHLALLETRQGELLGVLTQNGDIFEATGLESLASHVQQRFTQIDQIDVRKLLEREVLGHLFNVPSCSAADVNPDQRLAWLAASHLAQLRCTKPFRKVGVEGKMYRSIPVA